MWIDKPDQAVQIAAQLQGTQAPAALVSKVKIESLGSHVSIHRLAFHTTRQDFWLWLQSVQVPLVGWIAPD